MKYAQLVVNAAIVLPFITFSQAACPLADYGENAPDDAVHRSLQKDQIRCRNIATSNLDAIIGNRKQRALQESCFPT